MLLVCGLAVGALCVPVEAKQGGGVTLEGWWVFQIGLAILALLLALRFSTWRRTAWLGALLVLGFAGQLGLTSPLWLQYLEVRPWHLGEGTRPIACVAIGLQLLAVAIALRRGGRALAAGFRKLLTGRILAIGGVLFVFSAAHATIFYGHRGESGWLAGYAVQLAAIGGLFLLNVVHVALLAASVPSTALRGLGERFKRSLSWPGGGDAATPGDRRLPWIAAGLLLVFAASASWIVFERSPHLTDEVAYVFQARHFADGRLTSAPPPVPEAFEVPFVTTASGHQHVTTNPGWAAVLSIGVLAGYPWLINPLLGALCVLLIHSLVRRLSDRGTANIAALLSATSPWLIWLSASYMTHVLVLVLGLAGVRMALAAADARSGWRALLGGFAFGYAVLVRPLDGLIMGAFMGVWLLFGARAGVRIAAAYAVGCLAISIWMLPYNAHLTGEPLVDPMTPYIDELWGPGTNRFGFGPGIGRSWGNLDVVPGHGPVDVVLNANQNIYHLNFDLHGWVIGSLTLLFAGLALARRNRVDRWLLAFAGTFIAAVSCYWFSGGPDFGARYWMVLFLPLVYWSARGVATLASMARDRWGDALAGPRMAVVVALLIGLSLVTFNTWRAAARYVDYRGGHGDYLELLEAGRFGNALVLIEYVNAYDFGAAFCLNHPMHDAEHPVFAKSLGEESNSRLRAAFEGRPVLHVRGRLRPGDRIRIVDSEARD